MVQQRGELPKKEDKKKEAAKEGEAKEGAAKEEKKADAAPAAEEKKAEAPAAEAEAKPAEEKKVQLADIEVDDRSLNENDTEYGNFMAAAEAHPESKEPMPIAKKMAKVDPVIAAEIQEAEVAYAEAESKNTRAENEYDREYI